MSKHTSQTRLKSVIKLILNEIRNQSHTPSDFFKTHSAQVEPLLVKSMVSVLTPDYSATKFCLGKKKSTAGTGGTIFGIYAQEILLDYFTHKAPVSWQTSMTSSSQASKLNPPNECMNH